MASRFTTSQASVILPSSADGNIHRASLKLRLRDIPTGPGVYRWLDSNGGVLYVGKAKNLRRRMRSYVGAGREREGFRKRGLFQKMADLSITVTNTELEALVLETHLIRTLKPRYNIQLTKDTHYAFVKVTQLDDFASVQVVHRKESDGAAYFGPYSNPYSQRRMVEILRGLYHFRTCRMSLFVTRQQNLFGAPAQAKIPLDITANKKDRRLPCLDYHLEKCSGPCTGMVLPENYRSARIAGVTDFLGGKRHEVLGRLIDRLKQEREPSKKFDRAEELSFVLRYVQKMKSQCLFPVPGSIETDAIGYCVYRRRMHVVVLQVRGGNLINELAVCVGGAGDAETCLSQFLARYYEDVRDIPDRILVPSALEDHDLLEAWLSSRKGTAVRLVVPRDGSQADLLALAQRNATQKNDLQITKRKVLKGSVRNG
jgi:excinuclease ABC subunit C